MARFYGNKYRVAQEAGKPIAIFDKDTGDVLAYIPDGKTVVRQTGKECVDCTKENLRVGRKIARLLNQELPGTHVVNSCGRIKVRVPLKEPK